MIKVSFNNELRNVRSVSSVINYGNFIIKFAEFYNEPKVEDTLKTFLFTEYIYIEKIYYLDLPRNWSEQLFTIVNVPSSKKKTSNFMTRGSYI